MNKRITFGAAANLGHTNRSSFATPVVLNNGQLYYLSWTHNEGRWTIQPYVQVGHVPEDSHLGIDHSATTYGGAILGKYSFNDQWALAARADLLVGLLAHLGRRYAEWVADGPAATLGAFAARDALTGREVTVDLPGEQVIGTCDGTDDLGRLRVRTADGERLLGAGEVVRVSR